MNKLYKALASLVFALYIANTSARAQNIPQSLVHVGLGAEVGLPTGQLSDFYNFTVGGTMRVQYDLQSPVSFILTGGYTSFIGKQLYNTLNTAVTVNSPNRYPSYNLIPIKVGFKAFASSNLYFSAEGGAGFETQTNGNTKLILSPGFGYASGRGGWDFGLRYDYLSGQNTRSGQFVVKAGYDF